MTTKITNRQTTVTNDRPHHLIFTKFTLLKTPFRPLSPALILGVFCPLRRPPLLSILMIGNVLQADLEEIIKRKNWDELREALSELPPVDIAEVLIDLPVEDEGVIFRVLPRKMAALVFSYLPLDRQEELLHCFSNEQVRAILDQMTPDDRTRLLEETPAQVTRRLLETLSPDELKSARQLLGYPEASAGRYMTPEYVALPPEMLAKDALDQIRRTG